MHKFTSWDLSLVQVNAADTHFCLDIDECAEWDACQQRCRNVKGSYTCDCYDGYEKDGNECRATGTELLSGIVDVIGIERCSVLEKQSLYFVDVVYVETVKCAEAVKLGSVGSRVDVAVKP